MTGLVAGMTHLLRAFAAGTGFAMEQEIAAFALHALWQVPLLAGATALAVRVGRPHVRVAHGLWVATLAMCVLVPFASTVLAHRAAVVAARAVVVEVQSDGDVVGLGDWQTMHREPAWKLALERHILSPTPFAFTLSAPVARAITMVYALIALGFTARLLLGWRKTRKLVRAANTQPLPKSITQALHRQCDVIGCEAPLAALTEDLSGPALAGVLRPTLLMPAAAVEEMSSSEIEAVLAHELAHLRRGDPVLHAMCSLLLLPVGFHPAAMWTARRVRQTREMACDAEAAERLGSASAYAHALLKVAERSGGLRGAAVGLGLFGLGFFGLGLFDSEVRPCGGYRAALRGGRLQHGRRPATAGLPLFGVAGAMEERMQTMMNSNPPETGAKRAARGVAAAGLAAIAVMAAAMVQIQPALAHAQDSAGSETATTASAKDDGQPRLIGGDHAQQQLRNARRQLADAEKSASSDVERKRLAIAQEVIATAEQQLAAASGRDQQRIIVDLSDVKGLDPKVRADLEGLKHIRVDPQEIADAQKFRAESEARRAEMDANAAQIKAHYDSPEWKAQLQKQLAEAEQARAQVNSPEWKAQIQKQLAEAEHVRTPFNSPEFQAQIAAMHNLDHAKMEAQVREAVEIARKQMELGKQQRADAMKQMQEALRQQADAKQLMARNDMPAMPSPPIGLAAGQEVPKPTKIEGGIMAGQVLTKTQPKYPQSAKDAHVSGSVVLQAIIDETGVVQQLRLVSSPDKALTTSAMDAVRQWTYRPYLLNGKPTSVETTITVNYSFAGDDTPRPNGAMLKQDRPVLLTHVDPVMPYEARQRFYTDGLVTLRVQIGSTGKVDTVEAVTSPDLLLSNAAIQAVKQWTFKPLVRDGVPVAADTTVKVNFAIL